MENISTQEQVLEKKVEEKVEHVEHASIPDSQEIVKELANSSAILEKKAEEVKKIGWLKSKLNTFMDKVSGKVSKEEALKIIMSHPAKRATLADIKKQYPERADKYIEFIAKFPNIKNEGVKWYEGEFVHSSDNTEGSTLSKISAGTGSQISGK